MLRRTVAALSAAALLTTVAACGSDDKKDDAGQSLQSVSFTGAVGKSLKATWKSKATASKDSKVTTLVKGDGDAIKNGDTVTTYIWVGNGTTKKEAYSDYKNGQAESIPYSDQLTPFLKELMDGQKYGSRVASVTSAANVFGPQGNEQMGVGADDAVVVVADLVEKAPQSPTPDDDKVHDAPAAALPKVVEKGGKPTSLDFTGVKEPKLTTPVQRVFLKKGTGAVVKKTSTVTVNYLGQVYGAKAPFDESFSKQPYSSPLTSLVKGWAIGLEGVPAGSRVLLQMPPAFGYDAQGSGEAIPGNATLWFVIDVVSAK